MAHFPNVVAGRYYVLLDVAHYGFARVPHDDATLFPIVANFVVDEQ